MIDLLKLLGGWLVGLFKSHAAREAEVAFLRHCHGSRGWQAAGVKARLAG